MAPLPRYGSIAGDGHDEETSEQLLASNGNGPEAAGAASATATTTKSASSVPTRHRCVSYALTAGVCLFAAVYWHGRAASYGDGGGGGGGGARSRSRSVPTPPALSALDPRGDDLGFRATTRRGPASPSRAWGAWRAAEEPAEFTPLPTNEWYLNLLSHKAALDPASVGEVAHVYTIPYIVGVSPPLAPKLPSQKEAAVVAGIELFHPVMKTSAKNMQMVFDKNSGLSLGAVVDEKDRKKDGSVTPSLTSYVVDPDVPLSPLGVSLSWNHVNLKTHIVRGMPYGTVRFGRNEKGKMVLPTILAGNRPTSIELDSDDAVSGQSNQEEEGRMLCGSFTGKPVHQNPDHLAPISSDGKAHTYSARREIAFHMDQSDFTWVAFFSRPVEVRCYSDAMPDVSVPGPVEEVQFRLDVVGVADDKREGREELVVRVALLDECTTGKSDNKQHCNQLERLSYKTVSSKDRSREYRRALREGADLYPRSPAVGMQFPEEGGKSGDGEEETTQKEDKGRETKVVFDWDVTSVRDDAGKTRETAVPDANSTGLRTATSSEPVALDDSGDDSAFLMFALPHHMETLASAGQDAAAAGNEPPLCFHTFHGRTCLVRGLAAWDLPVPHGEPQSFLAARPPDAGAVPMLAAALREDTQFQISDNVLRGAADTYFPAKVLAKVGRIIEINEELQRLKSGKEDELNYNDADTAVIAEVVSAASEVALPSKAKIKSLLDDLQRAVEIWLIPGGKESGGGEAEFLYDATWGGFVNCGCKYQFEKKHESNGTCNNTFPDCPALENVNEDFGNGWYNDHHFHYGYHIYAAAVVAKHRPEWGRKYYESVLMYVRDIANPSPDDNFFPVFRQKDWYLGSSWAAGLMSMELSPHGREQESSSEAIAAFEGIALYGSVMMEVFARDEDKSESARLVRNIGEMLTAMEVSAANRFWHVWESSTDKDMPTNASVKNVKPHINTYPKQYPKHVVGMMYDTMASFQTWFAPEDVVSYGIQLIPLTAVAERRDDPEWSKLLYPAYAKSCKMANQENHGFCEDNGWSIVQTGLLAETGEIEDALEMASEIPKDIYYSDGGCGNSLSNTLWFVATRKKI